MKRLQRVVSILEKLISSSPKPRRGRPPLNGKGIANKASGKRIRRTGKELIKFRTMLKAEKKRGVPVAELAKKHGISLAYIYQIR